MNFTAKLNFLEQFPLFDSLTGSEKELLGQMVELKSKSRYSYVYLHGELSDKIFFLIKGTIKIGCHSSEGKEVIKTVLHPLAMFGEMGVVGEPTRRDFARVMGSEAQFFVLKVEDFKRLMRSNYALGNKVLNLVGQRLRSAEDRLESLIFKDARTRIVDFIRDAASKRGRQVGFETLIKHSLTQQDIANITGTSRQTVTSVLNELKKNNQIHFTRKSILVRDLQTLA
ncbi:MAG: Crp/Fnr family transcriptional regulator [Saprospiraceae bacterium]|nr:Crp/Fnr family transcriptional regulator [Saprospiraceae bacterium]